METPLAAFANTHFPALSPQQQKVPLRCSAFLKQRHSYSQIRRPTSFRSLTACASPPATKSLEEIITSIEQQKQDAVSEIKAAETAREVDDIRVKYLGKKGTITSVMKIVGKLDAKDRPSVGAAVNKAKTALSDLITERKTEIEDEAYAKQEDEEWVDVTMPGIRPRPMIGRIHPITSTMELATDIFVDIGYDCVDDLELNREVETDYYCFEALNCPAGHPAREMQDTFYLDADQKTLLRSQTSSVQIRYMEKHKPPYRIIAPGRVYRRDAVDATHTATFHQVEVLAIDKLGELNFGHLRATIIYFLKAMLGSDIKTRFRGSYFPFTEPSVEVDVYFRGKWLEVLGCGMVDPAVLENVGLDPKEWGGFAAGFGVERFAMVMHEITDIRDLYRNDLRFLRQGMTEPAVPAATLEEVQKEIQDSIEECDPDDPLLDTGDPEQEEEEEDEYEEYEHEDEYEH